MHGAASADALRPHSSLAMGRGVLLALLVHGLLLLALSGSLRWRSEQQVVATAELWSSVPQVAAPPPAPPASPPPVVAPVVPQAVPAKPAAPPPEAQIAVEKAKPKPTPKPKPEAAPATPAKPAKAEPKTRRERQEQAAQHARNEARNEAREEAELKRVREENLKRMLGQVPGQGSQASAAQRAEAAPSADYLSRQALRIRDRINFRSEDPGNAVVEVELRMAPTGAVLSRKVVKASTIKAWDEAVLRAIDNVAQLQPDANGRVPSALTIAFKRYE